MNIAVSPKTIPLSWEDYLTGNYDHSVIPWPRYRYSGTGVVEVPSELTRNIRIGKKLSRLFDDTDSGVVAYTNSVSVEVERSQKEERIPDVLVVPEECDTCFTQASQRLLDDAPGIITLAMPAPILVVEVVSPSSVKVDLEEKPFEMMERGVGEYVSIDWRKEIVQVWSCTEDGKNYNFSEYCTGDTGDAQVNQRIVLNSFPSLSITVDEMILRVGQIVSK